MSRLPLLPPRDCNTHKGDYGRALLVGGSQGMAGAISLAGMSTLRGGAGLVTLGVPKSILETVASFDPCLMTMPLPEHKSRPGQLCASITTNIELLARNSNCIAYGPGVGRSEDLNLLAAWLYECLPQPIVIDADGLNGLAQRPAKLSKAGGPRILTPHPGEFRRLIGQDASQRDDSERIATQLAAENNIVILLKGHRTLITDGQRTVHNETGNPGMATAGAGDVLTGIITALVCQGLAPFDAAQLAAHVHGLAGDFAAAKMGQIGMIASDIVRFLPAAMRSLENPSQ